MLSEDASSLTGWRRQLRLTGRDLLAIAILGWAGAAVVALLLVWQPTYDRVLALEQEKEHLLDLQSALVPPPPAVPTFEQLPDIMEVCRRTFQTHAVTVTGLNVERFSGQQSGANQDILDYAIVRLQLRGSWRDMAEGIIALEDESGLAIHVREAGLNADGGQALLQIYFAKDAALTSDI